MIGDSLEIFRDHDHVNCVLCRSEISARALRDALNQLLFYGFKQKVNHIVVGFHTACQLHVPIDISGDTVCHHALGFPAHFPDFREVGCLRDLRGDDDFRDIRCLVADSFHVRDHFQSGGNLPQVSRHRLLLQQELETQPLDIPFGLVDLRVFFDDKLCLFHVAVLQRLCRVLNRCFAKLSHLRQLLIQRNKFSVKSVAHFILPPARDQPNLPVI